MNETSPALAADALGVRFGSNWVLRDCSFELPPGRICGLVGHNGAGKTTLMRVAAGLQRPAEGSIEVWGVVPTNDRAPEGMALVSQEKPLYADLTVAEMLRVSRQLNTVWAPEVADRMIAEASIDPAKRIRTLSAGQRTRVALTVAIARRPRLLILDEPLADLDPLGRQDTMKALMRAAAEDGLTVLMSSHVVAELEDTCDHLLVLTGGGISLAGDIDTILEQHRVAVGPAGELPFHADSVVESTSTSRQTIALLNRVPQQRPGWELTRPQLEEVVLAHLRAASPTRAAEKEATA